jgi:hypothetical protein
MSQLQIRDLACYWQQSGWCAGGGALAEVLHTLADQKRLGCDVVVSPHQPGSGSVHSMLLPGLLLWQPSQSMEKAGGRCPCFVWQLSQLIVVFRKWRQGQQQNMVDLSLSGFRNSKHTCSPMYHAPWLELSTGICATLSGTHQAEQVSLHLTVVHLLSWIQGLNLNTGCHGLIIAATKGSNEFTWSPSHLWIWHHLFSSHQCTLTKEMNVGRNCPE